MSVKSPIGGQPGSVGSGDIIQGESLCLIEPVKEEWNINHIEADTLKAGWATFCILGQLGRWKKGLHSALDAYATVSSVPQSSEKVPAVGFVQEQALKSQLVLTEFFPEGRHKLRLATILFLPSWVMWKVNE